MSISIYTPAIPEMGWDIAPKIKEALGSVKETIDIREGRKSSLPNEKFVSLQDLLDLGLITQTNIDNKLGV